MTVQFRFYAELNQFLAPVHRFHSFDHALARDATVKHVIEALGVPHTEVEFILIDGEPVDFSHRLSRGERIAVYPSFGHQDVETSFRLRARPARTGAFIADAHLGQVAKYLRMLGFDVLYRNDYSDAEIARIAAGENRIVLTRDRDLLMRKEIVHGCYLHATSCEEQIVEVVHRFRLADKVQALSRCLSCNGMLRAVEKGAVMERVPQESGQYYEHFFECEACARVYWEGSHARRMRQHVERMLKLFFQGNKGRGD